mmetsp:Transcript_17941/g.33133  ORF Transcript_17941/g.33133 Transcript_17941/m.33133 type:complete len:83 (-) Transcript_17941:1284-1532(-)
METHCHQIYGVLGVRCTRKLALTHSKELDSKNASSLIFIFFFSSFSSLFSFTILNRRALAILRENVVIIDLNERRNGKNIYI